MNTPLARLPQILTETSALSRVFCAAVLLLAVTLLVGSVTTLAHAEVEDLDIELVVAEATTQIAIDEGIVLAVVALDGEGEPTNPAQTLSVELEATNGEFTTGTTSNGGECTGSEWESTHQLSVATNATRKAFCYRSSEPGTHTITATAGDLTTTLEVTVLEPNADISFSGLDNLFVDTENNYTATVSNVVGISDATPIRYRATLTEQEGGPVAGHETFFPDLGDNPEDRETWSSFTTDEDGVAYFGPSVGFTLGDVPDLKNETGVTTPFAATLDRGEYTLEVEIVRVDGAGEYTSLVSTTVTFSVDCAATILGDDESCFGSLGSAVDAAEEGDTVVLAQNITTSAQVTVNKPLTIDGNGFTLAANFAKIDNDNNAAIGIIGTENVRVQNLTLDGTGGQNLHGVNVYESTGVEMNDMVVINFTSGAGAIINGSIVAADNLTTSGNAWYAVNVDPGDGVTLPSVFTLTNSTLGEQVQILSDGTHVTESATVTVNATGYTEYDVAGTIKKIWNNKPIPNTVVIEKETEATLFDSIQNAVDAAEEGDTINVAEGTYEENVVIEQSLTIRGSGENSTFVESAGAGQPGEQGTIFFVRSGDVQIEQLSMSSGIRGITALTGAGVTLEVSSVTASDLVTGIYLNPGNNAVITNFTSTDNQVGIGGIDGNNTVTITDSVFTGSTDEGIGFIAAEDVEISVSDSRFSNNEFSIQGYAPWPTMYEGDETFVTATHNYWGHANGPAVGSEQSNRERVTAGVDFAPWYINSSMTALSTDISEGTLTPSGGGDYAVETSGQVVRLPDGVSKVALGNTSELDLFAGLANNKVVLETGAGSTVTLSNTALPTVSVTIPDQTEIEGPAGWNGKIQPPRTETASGNAPAGFSVGGTVISVGSSQGTLRFDKPVTLLLEGVTGTVGYKPALEDNWVEITNGCNGTFAAPTLSNGNECSITNGTDTKIVTNHFTLFGSLVAASSGGSASGSTASVAPSIPSAGEGVVLGAATFQFTAHMTIGSRGADVTELQRILRGAGYFNLEPTGYFGPITEAAVKQYQEAHGIPATGYVGPLTLARLNQAPDTTAQLTMLRQEALALMQQLLVLLQAQLEEAE